MTKPDPSWLVTGASGFLGANIGVALEGHAHRIAFTRSGETPSGFDMAIAGELSSAEALTAEIIERRPDVIVHAAAMASHDACERDPVRASLINGRATRILARAAEQAGSRFVYISTDAVFDGVRGYYAETDDPRPTSVYGKTKLEGEEQTRQATDGLIIRTNFFGWSPCGHRSILEFFVNELSAGNQVRGFTDFTTSSAYVQVLAETIRQLVDAKAAGTFHVTSRDSMTKFAFAVAVAEEFGLDPGLITPAAVDIDPPRKGDISLDVSKVRGTLGKDLPTMREGIRRAREDVGTLRQRLSTAARP